MCSVYLKPHDAEIVKGEAVPVKQFGATRSLCTLSVFSVRESWRRCSPPIPSSITPLASSWAVAPPPLPPPNHPIIPCPLPLPSELRCCRGEGRPERAMPRYHPARTSLWEVQGLWLCLEHTLTIMIKCSCGWRDSLNYTSHVLSKYKCGRGSDPFFFFLFLKCRLMSFP